MKVEIFNKNGLRKSIFAMMLALAFALTGCEAGLESGSSSSNGDDGDFSFSDMYSSITQLKDELASLRNMATNHENRITENETLLQKVAPAGTIVPFGGGIVPDGWLLCDGSSRLISGYEDLYQAIGTAWGSSNSSNFNLPDLRGYFLRGADRGTGRDPDAAGRIALNAGGNSGNNIGSYQDDEYERHTHSYKDVFYVTGSHSGKMTGEFDAHDENGWGYDHNRTTGISGSSLETRPKNAYVNYIIKY